MSETQIEVQTTSTYRWWRAGGEGKLPVNPAHVEQLKLDAENDIARHLRQGHVCAELITCVDDTHYRGHWERKETVVEGLPWFTVVGLYADTRQRWAEAYQAKDAAEAEAMAPNEIDVAGVFAGNLDAVL